MVDHGCARHEFIPPMLCMHCVCMWFIPPILCMHGVYVCGGGLFVTLCVTCNFVDDAGVCISKNIFKKPLMKPNLQEPDQWQLKLFCPAGKD